MKRKSLTTIRNKTTRNKAIMNIATNQTKRNETKRNETERNKDVSLAIFFSNYYHMIQCWTWRQAAVAYLTRGTHTRWERCKDSYRPTVDALWNSGMWKVTWCHVMSWHAKSRDVKSCHHYVYGCRNCLFLSEKTILFCCLQNVFLCWLLILSDCRAVNTACYL